MRARLVASSARALLPVVGLALGMAPAGRGEQRPAPVAQRFSEEAGRLLGGIGATSYRHQTRVNAAAGVYETDCSGLIAFLLRKVSPEHLRALSVAPGRKKPRAVEYHEFFRAQPPAGAATTTGWSRVVTLAEAQPGDVLAWRHARIEPGRNTGHVVILAAAPQRVDDATFRVAVVDSTGSPHDEDTRPRGSTGIGRGTMTFRVDAEGHPVAYRRNSAAEFRAAPIEIGRMAER